MPTTEGYHTPYLEAMTLVDLPIVTDIPGNQSWIKHRETDNLIEDYKKPMKYYGLSTMQHTEKKATKNNRLFVEKTNYRTNI
jgi:hypothetical protein